MGILALEADERVLNVEFTDDVLSVSLRDGRTITVPLTWYPRLLTASAAERENWDIAGGGYGVHWPDIDEDLSTAGLLRGAPAPRAQQTTIDQPVTAPASFVAVDRSRQDAGTQRFPLKDAYRFAESRGLGEKIRAIREMKIDWKGQKTYNSTVRRGYVIELLQEHELLDEFFSNHWQRGLAEEGLRECRSCLKVKSHYEELAHDSR